MVDRILVPMDDSEFAEQALEYALENFAGAAITVLHVVGVPSPMMGQAAGLALADDLEEAAADRAEPVFERAREVAADANQDIETAVGVGHPARAIIDASEDYDTVVLGAHGADWKEQGRRFLVGNVAKTVSERAPVPVVIVR